LAICSCRIMHLVKILDKLSVGDFRWVVGYLKSLGIYIMLAYLHCIADVVGEHTAGATRAHTSVAGILRIATNISDPRVIETFSAKVLAVHVLYTPKASGSNGSYASSFGHVCGAL
jgi:hypothetical protein